MKPDIETLKAWCHWKRKEKPPIDEDTLDLVSAVEDVISQVGTWKAKYETMRTKRDKLAIALKHGCGQCPPSPSGCPVCGAVGTEPHDDIAHIADVLSLDR